LPDDLRATVRGFVINKLRGDPALLAGGPEELRRRTGVPTLGVLPWLAGLEIDAEDSLALGSGWAKQGATLDVAVVRFPRISNFTDLDPLALEPGVGLRLVDSGSALGRPDLVVLPGTKSTVADLDWLCQRGLGPAIAGLDARTTILGICGGYQMLGTRIDDGVESDPPRTVPGLGLLAAETVFETAKVTRQATGSALGQRVTGYEIHHGRTHAAPGAGGWITPEGCQADGGRILGTNLHGLLDNDGFRAAFLQAVADRAGRPWVPSSLSFAAARCARFDRLADALEKHLDLAAIDQLITSA
jgi:adenosylcobyric acid synthase